MLEARGLFGGACYTYIWMRLLFWLELWPGAPQRDTLDLRCCLPFSLISMCPDHLCEHIFWMLDFTKMLAVTLHWDEFVLCPSRSPRPLPGTWVFFASLPISPFPLPRLLSCDTSLLPDELFSALSSGSGRLTPVHTLSFPESNQTGVPVWSASTIQQVLGLMSQLTTSWITTELETKTLNSGH